MAHFVTALDGSRHRSLRCQYSPDDNISAVDGLRFVIRAAIQVVFPHQPASASQGHSYPVRDRDDNIT